MHSFLAFLPLIITLVIAFKTRRLIPALISGISAAALIVKNFDIKAATQFAVASFLEKSEFINLFSINRFWQSDKLFIFLFLICVGAIIVLIEQSGASNAYAQFARKQIVNRRQAELATLSFSGFLFFDDYFNTITTGSVMTRVTDIFGIARLRVAQLIGNMAASIAAIMPLSTWGAAIAGTLASSGVPGNAFLVYTKSIPFALYPLILITVTWVMAFFKISFDKVTKAQDIADLTGNLFGGNEHSSSETLDKSGSLLDFVIVISLLITNLVGFILYTGNYWLFGGTNSLIQTLAATLVSKSLFLGGLTTLTLSACWLIARKSIKPIDVPKSLYEGFFMMWSSIVMLSLAWTFGNIVTQNLHIGSIITSWLMPHVPLNVLPLALFVITGAVTFATGSSWGAMALLFPLAIPIVVKFASQLLLLQSIGAILSGALLGNNTSPLTDLSVMTTTSTGTEHMDYVNAQIQMNRPIFIGSVVGFVISGTNSTFPPVLNFVWAFVGGLGVALALTWSLNKNN